MTHDFPILNALADRSSAMKDVCILGVLHVLPDVVPLVQCWAAAGCDPSDIRIVGIPYSSRLSAARRLRELGCRVDLPSVFPFDEAVEAASREAIEQARRSGKRVIVVEIGGYAVPMLTRLARGGLFDPALIAGAVEMTTRGVLENRLAAGVGLQWPMVTVPDCISKRRIEPPYVARAAHRSLGRAYHALELDPPRRVGVLGAGTLGMPVALHLAGLGARVAVADPRSDRMRQVALRGLQELTLEELGRCDLILGITGRTSIGAPQLDAAKDGALIASLSSRRVECDVEHLGAIARGVRTVSPSADCVLQIHTASVYTCVVAGATKELTLAYEGYPATLVVPGLPDHVRDVVNALAFAGAAAIARGEVRQPGIWPGSRVIGKEDRRIASEWLRLKPDDGVHQNGSLQEED